MCIFRIICILSLAISKLSAQENTPVYYAPEIFPAHLSGAVCGFLNKGLTMIFVREDSSVQKLFLYEAELISGKWTHVTLLPFSGNHNDMGGRLTDDGNILYFTSDRPGGSGRSDDTWNIWMTKRTDSGWTEPSPLQSINDLGAECCAVPISDDEILFSGDRQQETAWWIAVHNLRTREEVFLDSLNENRSWQWPSFVTHDFLLLNSMRKENNLGQDDIYISFRNDGMWTKPINLGPSVNTAVYEDGAILSPDGKLIFCRHETHATVSRVMAIDWEPLYQKLKK